MSLDDFAAVTRRVIAREGFEQFQPTAVYTERDHIKGGAGFPPDVPESHIPASDRGQSLHSTLIPIRLRSEDSEQETLCVDY